MDGYITVAGILRGELSSAVSLNGNLTVAERAETPEYTGSYEVTPSSQTQTIPIMGMKAVQDITVDPIPSNYGLITWNGSTLTVS